MHQSKKTPNPASKSHLGSGNSAPSDFQRRMGLWEEFEETNENEGHPQSTFTPISASASTKKKKILGERNQDDFHVATTPKEKLVMGFDRIEAHPQEVDLFSTGPPSVSGPSCSIPYDPVNNYTSPRPAFLRYNPDRRREILLRMSSEEESVGDSQDREKSIEEDSGSVSSTSPKPISPHEAETQEEIEYFEDDEVERRGPRCLRLVCKLLILFGVFLVSYHCLFPVNSSSGLLQENVPTAENSLDRDLLMARMGVRDVCLAIGEEMCGIEGPSGDLAVLDEFMGALDSGEHESIDGVEVLTEKYEELEDLDGVEIGEELDFVEENEEPVSFHESFENEEEILGNQAIDILSESVEALNDQFVSEEREEWAQSAVAPKLESVSSLRLDDQAAEESESPVLFETSPRWKLGVEFPSKDVQLLSISVSLLTATICVLTCLYKYYARSHQKSSRMSPRPSPVILPTDKPVDEWRISEDSNANCLSSNHFSNEHKESVIVPPSSMMGELRTEVKDSTVYSADELKGSYAIRPPTVELLGEFSIADALSSKYVENSSEVNRTVKVKSSLASTKIHPASARGHSVQEKLENKEDTVEKSEAKKAVATTPLRRSSRLQNRVNSPTP